MGFKERMLGDPDDGYYTCAWGLLEGHIDYTRIKQRMKPEWMDKIIAAIETIRTNRPEYRKVVIKGLDDIDDPKEKAHNENGDSALSHADKNYVKKIKKHLEKKCQK